MRTFAHKITKKLHFSRRSTNALLEKTITVGSGMSSEERKKNTINGFKNKLEGIRKTKISFFMD